MGRGPRRQRPPRQQPGQGDRRPAGYRRPRPLRRGRLSPPHRALSHPAVTGAQAVGQPDRRVGEVPVAYVTLAHGAVGEDDLRAWAAAPMSARRPPLPGPSVSSTRSRSPGSGSRTSSRCPPMPRFAC
ncbi:MULTISPECIES: AMP-binding enzyme [Streptomyces]|uniref:AMP-binding enzyme n=1 Tax=Streptomyces TaxID=1883 RepID=UPI00292F65DC|nr:hypothetical protein [Streptomyces sp. NEAU-HV9]